MSRYNLNNIGYASDLKFEIRRVVASDKYKVEFYCSIFNKSGDKLLSESVGNPILCDIVDTYIHKGDHHEVGYPEFIEMPEKINIDFIEIAGETIALTMTKSHLSFNPIVLKYGEYDHDINSIIENTIGYQDALEEYNKLMVRLELV